MSFVLEQIDNHSITKRNFISWNGAIQKEIHVEIHVLKCLFLPVYTTIVYIKITAANLSLQK